jgi:hypothetical protein
MTNNVCLQPAPQWRDGVEAVAPVRKRPRATNPSVRSLEERDLEPLADLFMQRFRKARRNARSRAEIAAYMKSLYLDYPTRDGAAGSLVWVDPAGAIGAFVGGICAGYSFQGSPLNTCVSGTLMASAAPGHALAAVHLLRESRKLDYDLIITDSANRASLAMCQAMNYQVASPDSLEWAYVFEPAAVGLHKLRRRFRAPWLSALKPAAKAADLAARAVLQAAVGASKRCEWRDEVVEPETFVDIEPRFLEAFKLRPDFSREEFLWLIGMARQRRSAGPLTLHIIYDPSGAPAAAYASFGGKGEVARVFHAVAAPHAWGKLFDKMLETARETGAIGIHGALRAPMMAHAYSVRGVFFYYAYGTMTYSNRPDIRRAIETGDALLGGFAGDRWTRLASDKFG